MKSKDESLRIEDIVNVVKKGWLIKRGKIVTNWKRRFFVLTNLVLYYFESDKPNAKLKGILDLSHNELCHTSRADLECLKTPSFKIKTPDRVLFAYSENLKEIESWIEEISNVIENGKKKKRNQLDKDISEEKVQKLVDQVEQMKKKIEEYIYCKIGTKEMTEDEKEKLYQDKQFERLVNETNMALEELSFAVQSFEEKMKRLTQKKESEYYRNFLESRKSFVEEVKKIDLKSREEKKEEKKLSLEQLKNLKKRSNTLMVEKEKIKEEIKEEIKE